MKIVMVDDENGSIHAFIDRVVENPDIDCKFFKDNKEDVLSYISSTRVNGAILDIKMPRIPGGGISLAEDIIAINPDIKIVFLTGLNTKLEDLPDNVRQHSLGIIYKPINDDELNYYLREMNNQTSTLDVKMFGGFDCFINGHLVQFTSKKSKELFALLLSLNGKSLTMEHALTCLWPDKEVLKSKILYRDAVWRLRQTLSNIKFNCVSFQRAVLLLDKSNIKCDYYEYLENKLKDVDEGTFLSEYEWSLDNSYFS